MDHELGQADKRIYEPPQLVAISLRPEEAVLGHCKTLNSGGQMGNSCNFLGIQPCGSSVGS
jgi:hypothetical protein